MVKTKTNFLKRAICAVMAFTMILGAVSFNAFADTTLEDGVYDVDAKFWNYSNNSNTESMEGSIESASMTIKNGTATVILSMQAIAGNYTTYVTDLQISTGSGEYVAATVNSTNAEYGYVTQYEFTLPAVAEETDILLGYGVIEIDQSHTGMVRVLVLDLENAVKVASFDDDTDVDSTVGASTGDSEENSEAAAELANGTYKVSADITDFEGAIEYAIVTVNDDSVTYTLYMQSAESRGMVFYISELAYESADGVYSAATASGAILDGYNYPVTYTFTLSELLESVNAQITYSVPDVWSHSGVERAIVLDLENSVLLDEQEEELDKDNLPDGIYEVSVDLWNASLDQASMASDGVIKTARIVAEDGVYTMYIYTQEMLMGTITASLIDLKISNGGGTYTMATVETTDANGNPTGFSFVLPSTDEFIDVLVNPYVDVMGNSDIAARLKIDWDTLTRVSDDTDLLEAPETTGVDDYEASSGESSDESSRKSSDTTADTVKTGDAYVIFTAVSAAAGIAAAVIAKKRALSGK